MNKGLIQEERRKAEAKRKEAQTGPTIRQHINAFNKLIGNTSTPTKP